MKDLSGATRNLGQQVKLITQTNTDHAAGIGRVLERLKDVRSIVDHNARSVHESRGATADLLKHAEALTGMLPNGAGGRRARPSNGSNDRA